MEYIGWAFVASWVVIGVAGVIANHREHKRRTTRNRDALNRRRASERGVDRW